MVQDDELVYARIGALHLTSEDRKTIASSRRSSTSDAIEVWEERGILGTQLGPNRTDGIGHGTV